jgi:F-type H+-transporting ATPase subunit b
VIARRFILVCAALALALVVAGPAAWAQEHQPAPSTEQPRGAEVHEPAAAGGHTAEEEHAEGIWPTIARLFNFAVLVGVLVYFLRAPIANYLTSRSDQIRSELVHARAMRDAAGAQLAEIERRMKALPAELDALRTRGAQEVAAEDARIRTAAEAERERLLAQMRREIDLQVRIARRMLVEEAAALAVDVARQRITREMTREDQMRLVARYTRQLGGAR